MSRQAEDEIKVSYSVEEIRIYELMAVYQKIAETLEDEIRSDLSSGEYLPSEGELAKRFSINRHTVRRAIDELITAGVVVRKHGKGTMVINNRIAYPIRSRARFSETLEEQGMASTSQVMSIDQIIADETQAKQLDVKVGEPLTRIDTLRTIEEIPVCLITHYLVTKLVPGIQERFNNGSLHAFIEEEYGLQIQRKQSLIGASLPTPAESRLLCCPKYLPLLVVKSSNTLRNDTRTIEYSVSRSRSDVFEMKVTPNSDLRNDSK